jgi:ABC-type glycerol-3-phosphate transport system substrate-binding protein
MKKLFFRFLCCSLAAVVALSADGCGFGGPSQREIEKADLDSIAAAYANMRSTLTEVSLGLPFYMAGDGEVIQYIENLLNISILVVNIDDEEILLLYETAGLLPDAVQMDIRSATFHRWVEKGVIRHIPEAMLEYFPAVYSAASRRPEWSALNSIYGKSMYIPVLGDTNPLYIADGGRIFYRADWAEELGIKEPVTTNEFYDMLVAMKSAYNTTPLALSGGASYVISLFGTDPESWVYEGDQWLPAFYSDRMLDGLNYARRLYTAGLIDVDFPITRANMAVDKFAEQNAGALIRYGDAYWMARVFEAFAEANALEEEVFVYYAIDDEDAPEGNEEDDAYDKEWARGEFWDDDDTDDEPEGPPGELVVLRYPLDIEDIVYTNIGVMTPPRAPNAQRGYWPLHIETDGFVFNSKTDYIKMNAILDLMQFTISEEGRVWARRYPDISILSILDKAHRSEIDTFLTPSAGDMCFQAAVAYNEYAINEGEGFAARFIQTPAKTAFYDDMNYTVAFNMIIVGDEPVEAMFREFKDVCDEFGIREVIREVTAKMTEIKRAGQAK